MSRTDRVQSALTPKKIDVCARMNHGGGWWRSHGAWYTCRPRVGTDGSAPMPSDLEGSFVANGNVMALFWRSGTPRPCAPAVSQTRLTWYAMTTQVRSALCRWNGVPTDQKAIILRAKSPVPTQAAADPLPLGTAGWGNVPGRSKRFLNGVPKHLGAFFENSRICDGAASAEYLWSPRQGFVLNHRHFTRWGFRPIVRFATSCFLEDRSINVWPDDPLRPGLLGGFYPNASDGKRLSNAWQGCKWQRPMVAARDVPQRRPSSKRPVLMRSKRQGRKYGAQDPWQNGANWPQNAITSRLWRRIYSWTGLQRANTARNSPFVHCRRKCLRPRFWEGVQLSNVQAGPGWSSLQSHRFASWYNGSPTASKVGKSRN